MAVKVHLAVDLGAGSGRVIAGIFDGKVLRIEEVNRFSNDGIRLPSGWHWNILRLFQDIKEGLREAAQRHGSSLVSLSVDTWGVDYGLIDRSGRLLGLPWMYRDSRTDGMRQEAEKVVSRSEMYRRTGIQPLFFNTVFQLFAETRADADIVAAADRILFIPDLLTFWLSGERVTERTNASTSQLLKAGSAEWDLDLAKTLGIPVGLLKPTTEPCTVVGQLLPAIAEETGCGKLRVTTCGSHDTASAVAGVPSSGRPLFLSSGTWSLLGCELTGPLVSEAGLEAGFSNEQGLNGTTRFLRNVAGMWLLQECRRTWEAQGGAPSYDDLVRDARQARIETLIDPDAPDFEKSCDMPAAITAYARQRGLAAPATPGEFTRVVLQSLAAKYRLLLDSLREWIPDLPGTLNVVGGGARNALLNQMTADATGLRVMTGPIEATAIGNVLAQLIATGEIASLSEGRELVRTSFQPEIFEPASAAGAPRAAAGS